MATKSKNGNKNGHGKRGQPPRVFKNGEKKKILELYLEGVPILHICAQMKMGHAQFYRLLRDDKDFLEAKKEAEGVRLMRTEDTLYQIANGLFPEREGFLPPDKTSLIFALKNWAPDRYRDRKEIDMRVENAESLADLIDGGEN